MSLKKAFIGYLMFAVATCVMAAYYLSVYFTSGMNGSGDVLSLFLSLALFFFSVISLVMSLKKLQ